MNLSRQNCHTIRRQACKFALEARTLDELSTSHSFASTTWSAQQLFKSTRKTLSRVSLSFCCLSVHKFRLFAAAKQSVASGQLQDDSSLFVRIYARARNQVREIKRKPALVPRGGRSGSASGASGVFAFWFRPGRRRCCARKFAARHPQLVARSSSCNSRAHIANLQQQQTQFLIN